MLGNEKRTPINTQWLLGPNQRSDVVSNQPVSHISGRRAPSFVYLILGLGILGVFVWGCTKVIGDSWQGMASRHWAKAEGIVVRTGLERKKSITGTSFGLQVTYRYTVDGREYENDRIRYPETRGGAEESYYQRQLDTEYPVGKPHAVYYNPANPMESCLVPGPSPNFMVMGVICLLAALAGGLYCLVVGIRWMRVRSATSTRNM